MAFGKAAAVPELRGRIVAVALILLLGTAVPLIAVAYLGQSLGVGWQAPWQLLLMFTGRQFGLPLSIALCALGGCLLAIVELAQRGREEVPSRPPVAPRIGRHAGPGALGGPPSTAVPGHKF